MFEQELAQLENDRRLRSLVTVEPGQGARASVQGKPVLLLCSNDYLGLAGHPALRQAAALAMERYGFGSGASRLVSGNSALHEELEGRIAAFKGTEAAMVFNSGYAANTGVIPALAGEGDALFSDELNHGSIIDGCRLSRARTFVYRHCDLDHLEALLREHGSRRRKVIITDGVFSMDGDIAPLPGLLSLAERHGAVLMVDDAHATGVLGAGGRGTAEHFGLSGKVHIQMGTLGKALGSFGAYVAGDRDLVRYLLNKSRSYIFSTSLPPAVCAASLAAFNVLEQEPWRKERLWENRKRFVDGLNSLGIDAAPSETPIVPILINSAEKALQAAGALLEQGIFAPAIRPPSVPANASRIRTTVTAVHGEEDLDQAITAFSRLKQDGLIP